MKNGHHDQPRQFIEESIKFGDPWFERVRVHGHHAGNMTAGRHGAVTGAERSMLNNDHSTEREERRENQLQWGKAFGTSELIP